MVSANEFKDDESKKLIKLNAFMKSFESNNFIYNPVLQLKKTNLHCLEVFINQRKDNLSFCSMFFVCNTHTIYIEDYNKIFTSKKFTSDKDIQILFQSLIKEIFILFDNVYGKISPWKNIVLTTSIPENFDILISLGFRQDKVLNHYGNTRFIYNHNS